MRGVVGLMQVDTCSAFRADPSAPGGVGDADLLASTLVALLQGGAGIRVAQNLIAPLHVQVRARVCVCACLRKCVYVCGLSCMCASMCVLCMFVFVCMCVHCVCMDGSEMQMCVAVGQVPRNRHRCT